MTLSSVLGNLLAYDVFSFQTTCWYEFEWMVITVSSNTFRPIQGCMYVCIQKVLPSRGLNWENKEESNLRLFLLFEKKKSGIVLWKKKCSTPRLRSE